MKEVIIYNSLKQKINAALSGHVPYFDALWSQTATKPVYSQTWLQSHCLQHQPLYNNTHDRNRFNGLCTKCPGYNNNLVITAHFSGTKGVVVNKFDCICTQTRL